MVNHVEISVPNYTDNSSKATEALRREGVDPESVLSYLSKLRNDSLPPGFPEVEFYNDLVEKTGAILLPDVVDRKAQDLRGKIDKTESTEEAFEQFQSYMSSNGEAMYKAMDTGKDGLSKLTKVLNEAFEGSPYEFDSEACRCYGDPDGDIIMRRRDDPAETSRFAVGKGQDA